MRGLKALMAAGVLAVFAGPAFAGPISGGIGFSGGFRALDGIGGSEVNDLNNAVYIETNDLTMSAVDVEGDLNDVTPGTDVDEYADFFLDGSGLPISTFWQVTGQTTTFTFTMTEFSIPDRNTDFIDIVGKGFISAPGFDTTNAVYNASLNRLDANGMFTISTFSDATVATPDVPEPATLLLIGTGLLAAGGMAARRRAAA